MKKLVTLILIILAITAIRAQQSESVLPEQIHLKDATESDYSEVKPAQKFFTDMRATMVANDGLLILDSIIYYQFQSTSDSAKTAMDDYDWSVSENQWTIISRLWDEINQQWDNTDKVIYNYYADDHRLNYYYHYSWDEDEDDWFMDIDVNYAYDENGYEIFFSDLRWNTELSRWDKLYKWDMLNDVDGNQLLKIEWDGDENNNWLRDRKTTRLFNSDSTLDIEKQYTWYKSEDKWQESFMKTFEYNENALLITNLNFNWNDEWTLRDKYEYEYNSSDLLAKRTFFEFESDNWEFKRKQEYTYDEQERVTLELIIDYDDGQWTFDSKYTYEYIDNSLRMTYSDWYTNLNDWVPYYKYEYDYDEYGQILSSAWYNWDSSNENWEGQRKYTQTFLEENKRSLVIDYKWDDLSMSWLIDVKKFYHYQTPTALPEAISNDFTIFPNPTADVLSIRSQDSENTSCKLVSTSGQVVRQFYLTEKISSISLADLPSGIYFLQINQGQYIITEKIIKQ